MKNEDHLPLRLMFQDEARFGRMSDPRSCWAPAPHRPIVNWALVREFRYEYAAVSPWDGCLDFMTAEKMNTDGMSRFLIQVSEAHKDEFIVMVVDGIVHNPCPFYGNGAISARWAAVPRAALTIAS